MCLQMTSKEMRHIEKLLTRCSKILMSGVFPSNPIYFFDNCLWPTKTVMIGMLEVLDHQMHDVFGNHHSYYINKFT